MSDRYDIPYETLRDRLKGAVSYSEAHQEQLLSPIEEKALIRWIEKLEAWGFPPKLGHVKQAAIVLLKARNDAVTEVMEVTEVTENSEVVGKHWLDRLLGRHPTLNTRFTTQIDNKRIEASTPHIIQGHFRKLKTIVQDFSPSNI